MGERQEPGHRAGTTLMTDETFFSRIRKVLRILNLRTAVDILVHTPAEFRACRSRETSSSRPSCPRGSCSMGESGRHEEARRWILQARFDLKAVEWSLEGGFFNTVCFLAQQSAEKALKSALH